MFEQPSRPESAWKLPFALTALAVLVFAAILIRTGWISDDAAITQRTVLNVTHGFGLRYNIAERVQTFTHPLWLALLTAAYLIVGNIHVATFALSIVCSIAAFWLAIGRAASPAQACLAGAVLFLSAAFVDYATSGLENPLCNVLIAVFVGWYFRHEVALSRWLTGLWTIAALLYLTRQDAILIVVPLLTVACWEVRRLSVVVRTALVGLTPAIAWTIFSLLYYGFPAPNTAYAKLATGISAAEMRVQGVLYLVDSVDRDPITLATIAFAILMGAMQRRLSYRAVTAGLLLYLMYVVSIGGDFMAGRFLAVPLYVATVLLARLPSIPRMTWSVATAILVVIGLTSMPLPLASNSQVAGPNTKRNGVTDERAFYFKDRSLVLANRISLRDPDWPRARHASTQPQRVLDTCGGMGTTGLDFGPYVHLLDECALADPLLARLPAVFNVEWRPGHFRRSIPVGYRETLEQSSNLLADPALHEYYERLRLITRSSSLWSWDRLRAIAVMNAGGYDHLIRRDHYRHNGSIARLDEFATVRSDGTPWNADGNRVLVIPLAVACESKPGRRYVDVSLDADDRYLLTFLKDARTMSTLQLGPIPEHRRKPGLVSYTSDIPPRARDEGFDTVIVAPIGGNDQYALGHLLLDGFPATDAVLKERVAARDAFLARAQAGGRD